MGAGAACDENTIGVVAILGSTFDGSYKPVQEIAAALDELLAGGGPDIPVHVDGASGGTIAPFLDPDLPWDFRLERVASINTSGHKYGLVYPGVGWVLWRDKTHQPEEPVFHVNYLGGNMPTFALNFSRSTGSPPYNRRLGTWLCRCRADRRSLSELRLITRGNQLPVFAFTTSDTVTGWDVFAVSRRLRERGW